jgi:small-conductance mechanosensitive channel
MRFLAPAAFAFALALASTPAALAQAPRAPPPAATTAPPAETLAIGHRDIITFRATVLGYTPHDRALGARHRLLQAYDADSRLKLSLRQVAEGTQVLADGATMFIIVEADANGPAGETAAALGAQAVHQLQTIVDELHERTDGPALMQAAGYAVVATLAWILVVRVILAVGRRVRLWAWRFAGEKVRHVTVSGQQLIAGSYVTRAAIQLVMLAQWLAIAAVTFMWLNAVLLAFPHTRSWGEGLAKQLGDTLTSIGVAALESIPGLATVVLIFFLARLVVSAGKGFFERAGRSKTGVGGIDRDTAEPTSMLFTGLVWILAVVMAYPYFPGSGSPAFQGLSVLLGLLVTIGGSSTVGQGMSGLILMYSRAFRVGEYVRIDKVEGVVTRFTLFTVRLRTDAGEIVILPNSYVASQSPINLSREHAEGAFLVDATATIGYDTPWRQVHEMLLEAAKRTPELATDPKPFVMQTALSDFYPEYRLVAATRPELRPLRAQVRSALHANIQDVFAEAGVQIMSPHYMVDPAAAKIPAR